MIEETFTKRYNIVKALCESPHSKSELENQLTVSRSTIDRGIDELIDHGCIKKKKSRFKMTELGRVTFNEYENCLQLIQIAEEAEPLLELLPPGTVSRDFLKEATIQTVNPRVPMQIFEETKSFMINSNRLYRTIPVAYWHDFRNFEEAVSENNVKVEVLVDYSLQASVSDQYQELIDELSSDGLFTLEVAEIPSSHAVWIAESNDGDTAGIIVYDGGVAKGQIYNSTSEAVDWVREQYDEFSVVEQPTV